MEKWEYKTIIIDREGIFRTKFEIDENLNEMGNEGWELVSIVSPVAGSGMSVQMFATFKRKKQ